MTPRVVLGPFLGHVGTDEIRVWARTDPPSDAGGPTLEVESEALSGARAGGTCRTLATLSTRAADGGCGVVVLPLRGGAGELHRLTTRAPDGRVLARPVVRAAPAPSADGHVAFAFGSCFRIDSVPDPGACWRILASLARARWAEHLMLLGDQVYADATPLPGGRGKKDAAAQRALELGPGADLEARTQPYRLAYEQAWSHPDAHAAQAALPTTLVWDDHEIIDGYGSDPWDRSAEGQALFEAGQRAFEEHQAMRNPPPLVAGARAHVFRRGPASFLTLDLRTHRDAARSILIGEAQARAVEAHVRGEAREASLLFIACSVPPIHLPIIRRWRRHDDVMDQWSSPVNEVERRWLLGLIEDYEEGGRRRVVLLGGDVHVATAATLRAKGGPPTWQVTSSPIAHALPWYVRSGLALARKSFDVETSKGHVLESRIVRRWHGPNVGLVRGSVEGGRASLAFELYRPGRRTELLRLE